MRRRLSVCMFLYILLLLAACGSPAEEQEPEDLVELDKAAAAPPTVQPTLPPTEEAVTSTRSATETPAETETSTATSMPTETPTDIPTIVPDPPTLVPRDTSTGIPEVDLVIETILSNDLEARQELLRFVTLECTTAEGLGTAPKCEEGQAEGTPVEVFPLGGPGEGHSIPASEVASALEFEAESIYAAYVVSEDLPDFVDYPRGTYALFFTIEPSGEADNDSVILRVDGDGYIVRLDSLGGMPLDFYLQQMVADLLETPPQDVIFASEAAEILVYPPETNQ